VYLTAFKIVDHDIDHGDAQSKIQGISCRLVHVLDVGQGRNRIQHSTL